MKNIAIILCSFKHEQYPSNSVDLWCLIIEYPNASIGFIVGFGYDYVLPLQVSKYIYL